MDPYSNMGKMKKLRSNQVGLELLEKLRLIDQNNKFVKEHANGNIAEADIKEKLFRKNWKVYF